MGLEKYNAITEKIIGCAYRVANRLGVGFLEKVYENALAYELRKLGLRVEQQASIKVTYDGIVIGSFVADLIVEGVVVEIKACSRLTDLHFAQCLNYLKAIDLPICLLINFGLPRIEVKRIVQMATA